MSEAQKVICSMIGVGKRHDKKVILRDIYLSYFYGAKIGVLGLNGAGKSSLLRILAGVDKDFDGQLVMNGDFRIGYLQQEPQLTEGATVLECVQEGVADTLAVIQKFEEINEKFAEPMDDDEMNALLEEQGKIQDQLDKLDAWNLDQQLEMAMDALRCPDPDAIVDNLSGGERRRVAICRLLLSKPDILLLDEPTNHLDAESVAWLEQYLHRFEGTVIAVTHDRYFLDNVAGWILELDRGHGIPWKGNYSSWLEQKQKRLEQEEKAEASRQRTLARELEWVRQSPSARRAKNKARITAYENLLAQDYDKLREEIEIFIPPGNRLGAKVFEATKLAKGFDDTLLYSDVNFTIPAGAIVGIIGPNGSGKTTMLKMMTGDEKPTDGQLKVGESVQLSYVTQGRDELAGDDTVWDAISEGSEFFKVGNTQVNTRAYVSRFGFTGSDQSRLVGTLSGGERNRVHLAKLLRSGCNVLLLDEPTNDLDVNTSRSLEDAITHFAGCVLVVSHDRWFLDRIATHILAFEGDSQVKFFEGNWTAYEEDRRKRLGAEADQPHRIKFRKLSK